MRIIGGGFVAIYNKHTWALTFFLFQAHQRLVTTMRIIGGGFVALTFDSEFTCQKARDQSIVENRGAQRGYPPLNEWTVLTAG